MSVGIPEKLPQPKASGRVTFPTLTDQTSQRTAPSPNGKVIYPGTFRACGRHRLRTCPVEVRCSLAAIGNVHRMQGAPDESRDRRPRAGISRPRGAGEWSADGSVRVAAQRYNGATYVVAVNTATAPATASFTVAGVGGRTLRAFREGRTLTPLGDLVVDKLPGLGVAVYVVPPPGWLLSTAEAGAS